jgi:adenylate cyclase
MIASADAIADWMVSAALAGESEIAILAGMCERLNAAGLSLVRASVANDLLDPTFDARGVLWTRERGGFDEGFLRREEVADTWLLSPFRMLVESGEPMLRRRLDAAYRRGEFPILDRLQDEGARDYLALLSRVGEGVVLGEGEGIVASWTTDAPGGFTDADVARLRGLLPLLTLVITMRTVHRTARTLLTTYLGSDAAERVLAGNVVRGRAEPIQSVVWYSDLTGFTRIADAAGPAATLALLNDYAEAQVEEIEAQGGHVLKFIGDGILAIFPHEDTAVACRRALNAADRQQRRIRALNAKREAAGLPVTSTHVALHVGELLYGNLGSERRLDFTVLGPAVNEVARIEALCASLDREIVVSSAFAQAAPDVRERLVSLGRYAMKGVAQPQELLTLDT